MLWNRDRQIPFHSDFVEFNNNFLYISGLFHSLYTMNGNPSFLESPDILSHGSQA